MISNTFPKIRKTSNNRALPGWINTKNKSTNHKTHLDLSDLLLKNKASGFPSLFYESLPFLPLLFFSRSAALRCDEVESSPQPAQDFLLLDALFYFSPLAATATAAQLVSVPSPHPPLAPTAYDSGRFGRRRFIRLFGPLSHGELQVSSACKVSQVYVHVLSDARCVFDMAGEHGFKISILDNGGDFTGTEIQLEEVNHVIRPLSDIYFPEGSGFKIISESGSYYVCSAFTLAVNIIAKEVVENDKFSSGVGKNGSDDPACMYHVNEGDYGSFASKVSEDFNTIPEVHKKYKEDELLFTSSLWGPSCDELDKIVEICLLPELNVGNWLIFANMGADSFQEPSAINDFQRPSIYYMMLFSDWYEMQDAGIPSDTMMRFFVPSCILLSEEDCFPTEA
ncbi:LOW QUALITY PROTEIN: antizyme inhibitor 1-like [Choloepus didactylus]|uniref:LOW QUALITY PROTEIN: antizyme inhibitor 1-like n=1 Tax=Choloepus didactylus TaxID=27675 RepID=UPI00189E3E5C|nr:LOW QUALITY PROTEIN: antizyme inhibitor 1-like [Choloepus didactylus]